jgi:hypothetical protein
MGYTGWKYWRDEDYARVLAGPPSRLQRSILRNTTPGGVIRTLATQRYGWTEPPTEPQTRIERLLQRIRCR